MASLRAEGIDTLTLNSGIDTLVPVLVRVARVTSPTHKNCHTHAATCAATAAGAAR